MELLAFVIFFVFWPAVASFRRTNTTARVLMRDKLGVGPDPANLKGVLIVAKCFDVTVWLAVTIFALMRLL